MSRTREVTQQVFPVFQLQDVRVQNKRSHHQSPGDWAPAVDAAPMISVDGRFTRSCSNLGSGKSDNPGNLVVVHGARPPSRLQGERRHLEISRLGGP